MQHGRKRRIYRGLERLVAWVEKNALGQTSVTIAVAGIIITIVVSVRKAIASQGKKLGSLLVPLLKVVAEVISPGAKCISWLASNL